MKPDLLVTAVVQNGDIVEVETMFGGANMFEHFRSFLLVDNVPLMFIHALLQLSSGFPYVFCIATLAV